MAGEISKLGCIPSCCVSCQAEVARLKARHLCPHCNVGEFGTAPSGPKDTYVCSHCGAISLPGRTTSITE